MFGNIAKASLLVCICKQGKGKESEFFKDLTRPKLGTCGIFWFKKCKLNTYFFQTYSL